jgi:hypothetical protein
MPGLLGGGCCRFYREEPLTKNMPFKEIDLKSMT